MGVRVARAVARGKGRGEKKIIDRCLMFSYLAYHILLFSLSD